MHRAGGKMHRAVAVDRLPFAAGSRNEGDIFEAMAALRDRIGGPVDDETFTPPSQAGRDQVRTIG